MLFSIWSVKRRVWQICFLQLLVFLSQQNLFIFSCSTLAKICVFNRPLLFSSWNLLHFPPTSHHHYTTASVYSTGITDLSQKYLKDFNFNHFTQITTSTPKRAFETLCVFVSVPKVFDLGYRKIGSVKSFSRNLQQENNLFFSATCSKEDQAESCRFPYVII